jgi:hypothetical protein
MGEVEKRDDYDLNDFLIRVHACLSFLEVVYAKAIMAPGVVAIFTKPNPTGYYQLLFDRDQWEASLTMLGLWGDRVLHPAIWTEQRMGYVPSREETTDPDFLWFGLRAQEFVLPRQNLGWFNQPQLLQTKQMRLRI